MPNKGKRVNLTFSEEEYAMILEFLSNKDNDIYWLNLCVAHFCRFCVIDYIRKHDEFSKMLPY